uniref:Anti-sigma factor antagonist n=1 Tax=Schlesneria paludicola TaxID=360056 RepID=A0A7C4QPC2_9PLAN
MLSMDLLEIYEAGELTVVGFGGREVLDHINLAECRDELLALIREHQTQTLAIDLTGVKLLPSGLLGLLASVHRLGVEVQLYNACKDIREVLEITKLDQVMHLHEVEV